jgi:hypothetical protein
MMHWGVHDGAFAVWLGGDCLARLPDACAARALAASLLAGQPTVNGVRIEGRKCDCLVRDLMGFVCDA